MELNRRPWLFVGWHLDALALALYVFTFGLMAGLGGDIGLGLVAALGWLVTAAVWLGRVLKWCYRRFLARSLRSEAFERSRRSDLRHFGLLPLLALWLIGLSRTDWPLRLVFLLHRPALERFATQASSQNRAFNAQAPGQRVGLYVIWRVQKVPGGVRFVTRDDSFFDESYSGLVFYLDGSESSLLPFPTWPYDYADARQRLDERWLLWSGGLNRD